MHKLLLRQLRKYKGSEQIPEEWLGFIQAVSEAYYQSDEDQILIERTLEISSQELIDKNTELTNALTNLKNTHEKLVHSSKMASLGVLAAGVAHEINNPVSFVLNNITLFHRYINEFKTIFELYQKLNEKIDCELTNLKNNEIVKIKNEIEFQMKNKKINFMIRDIDSLVFDCIKGLKSVTEIVFSLKSFARVDSAEVSEINIHDCLDSTIKMASNELRYKCEIYKDYKAIRKIYCYPGKLNQVFMNLIVNAAHSIEDKGKIEILTFETDENLIIKIIDNGCGIPKENLQKIFDPFFTTKQIGSTGLGLSISYGIIKQHKGEISIESEVGKGTTFTVQLPFDLR